MGAYPACLSSVRYCQFLEEVYKKKEITIRIYQERYSYAVYSMESLWETRFPSFREEMNKVFEDFFSTAGFTSLKEGGLMPAVDVHETKSDVVIAMAIPAINPRDISISVMEDNFDSVKYIDNNSKLPRWTTICSSLKNNVCSKLILLSTGAHSLDFKVSDKAGNTALRHIDITI